jgi:hypothetical protein
MLRPAVARPSEQIVSNLKFEALTHNLEILDIIGRLAFGIAFKPSQ